MKKTNRQKHGFKQYWVRTGILFEKVGYTTNLTKKNKVIKRFWKFNSGSRKKALEYCKDYVNNQGFNYFVPSRPQFQSNFILGKGYLIQKEIIKNKKVKILVSDEKGIKRFVFPKINELK